LVIPSVLALLGDNPMQSEMACHIGLMGKLFCRVCGVKGMERSRPANTASGAATEHGNSSDNGGGVTGGDASGSEAGSTSNAATNPKKKIQETMEQMVARVWAFVKVH